MKNKNKKEIKKFEYSEKNPLVRYQLKLAKESVGKGINVWNEVAARAGIHVQTIFNLARKNKKEVLGMSLGVYLKLKKNLGVDMLD